MQRWRGCERLAARALPGRVAATGSDGEGVAATVSVIPRSSASLW